MTDKSLADAGRAPSGQALAVPAKPFGLDASRCDPSRVRLLDAQCWQVRNGHEWASIFVRSGHTGDRHWADVAVNGSFGSFGYYWSHMGRPWAEFCQRLDFDYAMGKFMGARFYEPLDLHDCVEETRKIVIERRRSGCMDKQDARALWDGADRCEDRAAFLRDLDDYSDGAMYRHELWDSRWERPSRQARGFWREIWPHYVAAIAMETREGGDVKQAPSRSDDSATIAQNPPSDPSERSA